MSELEKSEDIVSKHVIDFVACLKNNGVNLDELKKAFAEHGKLEARKDSAEYLKLQSVQNNPDQEKDDNPII